MNNCLLTGSLLFCLASSGGAALFQDDFNRPDGLVTNEYAFWNPSDPASVASPDWELDSGSFFIQGGSGWTGIPDDTAPNALSTNGTNSAIFRLNTKRSDFGDVSVSFSLFNQGLSSTPTTPPVDWDGLHIWLHYQTEYNLYYASINRRDNTSVIKKKIPGGPSNGGTYYDLTAYVPHTVRYNTWQNVTASVQNNADGSVTIKLYDNGTLVVSATDDGKIGGPPIRGAGKVGIRGDNANLKFDNFVVQDLAAAPINPVSVTPSLDGVRVYPNPWRSDHTPTIPITFDHLTPDSTVKIFNIAGRKVKELPATSSRVTWDMTNDAVEKVGSGLYIYLITDNQNQKRTGKLAIIR